MAGEFTRVTGLFKQTAKKTGATFYSGKLRAEDMSRLADFLAQYPSGCEVVLFKNDKRPGKSDPDLSLNVKPPYERDDSDDF